jgi:hypothetical protein
MLCRDAVHVDLEADGHDRSHVYTTFHKNEIHLDEIILDADWENPEMMLTGTNSNLEKWQVDTALATWRAMRNSTSWLELRD